jgi:sortase (surface protein transpeptidase)
VEHFQHSVLKASKKLQNKLKTLFPNRSYILIFIGIFLFVFGWVNYYRVRILSFSSVPPGAAKSTQNADIPIEVIVPSVGIDIKVDPGQIKGGVWQISGSNATFLDTSAVPGTGGNTVIYAHNKKAIFGNLPYLSVGQKIAIKTKSGKIFNYVASEKYFVGSARVDLVSPTNTEVLTLYTCWGIFDNQRAVIRAVPVKF